MALRYRWVLPTFVVAHVVQPGAVIGCSSDTTAEYEFGKPELLGVIDEANSGGAWTFESAAQQYTLEVMVQDASSDQPADEKSRMQATQLLLRRARACGSHVRTFIATASACDDAYETQLPVTGNVRVQRREGLEATLFFEGAAQGHLEVPGLSLDDASNVRITLKTGTLEIVLVRPNPSDAFTLDNLIAPSLGIKTPVRGSPVSETP